MKNDSPVSEGNFQKKKKAKKKTKGQNADSLWGAPARLCVRWKCQESALSLVPQRSENLGERERERGVKTIPLIFSLRPPPFPRRIMGCCEKKRNIGLSEESERT